MASVAQMRCRMLDIHWRVLRRLERGEPAVDDYTKTAAPLSNLRGYQRVLSTLRRWGAIDSNGLTPLGRELIAAKPPWEAK